jgi:hypothetical protein
MTTTRTPIRRPPRGRFSDAALDTFLALRHVIENRPCTCRPVDGWKRGPPCSACLEYQELHGQLANLWPGVRPWDWPIVERPEGSGPARRWRPDEEAVKRWFEIEAACAERERERERAAAEPPAPVA